MLNFLKRFVRRNLVFRKLIILPVNIIIGIFGFIYRYKYFLSSCYISASVRVTGWRSIYIESNVTICHGTWINVNFRKKLRQVVIKQNSFIGSNNFFSSGGDIVISEYCLTASNCSFICSSHIVDNPLSPYISTGVTEGASIYVGPNCFFGYNSSVIGNVSIGHGSVIGANAVVINDIPPFSIVVGNPARIIKRYDFKHERWTRDFSGLDKSSFLNKIDYLNALQGEVKYPLLPSILSSKYFSSIY